MSEYLAPGVFVEEVRFQPSQIQPASTSVAGMIGPARFGPVRGVPQLLTCFSDFQNAFGDPGDLAFSDAGTIRKLFAESKGSNSTHGSDSPAAADREIALNFRLDEIVG